MSIMEIKIGYFWGEILKSIIGKKISVIHLGIIMCKYIDNSYEMMKKCWEMAPDDRPAFKQLNKNTSIYIERIAGYLELGFNPFAGMEDISGEEEKQMEDEEGVALSAGLSQ